ncbi:hypothetical protein EBR66_07715 [bacterium]|nr:hypothetical protein [bacterium]
MVFTPSCCFANIHASGVKRVKQYTIEYVEILFKTFTLSAYAYALFVLFPVYPNCIELSVEDHIGVFVKAVVIASYPFPDLSFQLVRGPFVGGVPVPNGSEASRKSCNPAAVGIEMAPPLWRLLFRLRRVI